MRAKPFELPASAAAHVPDKAVRNIAEHAAVETFATVSYEGVNGGIPVTGLFVEVDQDTWVENDIFTFQEVSERHGVVVLFDSSRDLTATIDLATNDISITFGANEVIYNVTDVSYSLRPIIPDGWLF